MLSLAQSADWLIDWLLRSVCWWITQSGYAQSSDWLIATLSLLIDYSSLIHYMLLIECADWRWDDWLWLIDCGFVIDWLIDWLIDCYAQTAQSADWRWDDWLWLIDWLLCSVCSVCWLSVLIEDEMIDWLIDCYVQSADWLSDWLITVVWLNQSADWLQ